MNEVKYGSKYILFREIPTTIITDEMVSGE